MELYENNFIYNLGPFFIKLYKYLLTIYCVLYNTIILYVVLKIV